MVNIVDTDVHYTLRVKRINPKSYPKGKKISFVSFSFILYLYYMMGFPGG